MKLNKDKQYHLRFIIWFFILNSVLFCLTGIIYLNHILGSSTLFENTMADYTSFSGRLFVVIFAVVNYLSYMTGLAFIPALLILMVGYFFPYKRLIWSLCVITASLSLVLLLINNYVYLMYKFHVDESILRLIFDGYWFTLFDLSRLEVLTLFLIVAVIALLELSMAFFVWKRIVLAEYFKWGQTLFLIWLGAFLFSYFSLVYSIARNNNLLSQQTPNLPLYNQLIALLVPDKNAADIFYRYGEDHFSQPLFANDDLHYPLHAMKCSKPEKPLNVILIMVDSLRFDSVQTQLMPHLSKFAQTSWRFQNYLSGGNATQPGVFSLFYALPGSYWTAALKQKVPPVFIQLLQHYGYSMRIIWSAVVENPPFNKTIFNTISPENIEVPSGNDIGNRDRYLTKAAIQFLSEAHQKQPFFMNIFYDAAHAYCRDQSFPARHQPALKACSRIAMTNDRDPLPLYNRYLNGVAFIDEQLKQLLDVIDTQGYLKNSIVLITSDHGEEFNDNKGNYWGHASNFSRVQVHVPLIIHWPDKKPQTITYLTNSYDVMPTLLKHLFQCQNQLIDYSIGQDLLIQDNRLPFVLVGSYSNMGLVENNQLVTLRTSGGIVVSDLRAQRLTGAKPDNLNLIKALELMRLYYKKP